MVNSIDRAPMYIDRAMAGLSTAPDRASRQPIPNFRAASISGSSPFNALNQRADRQGIRGSVRNGASEQRECPLGHHGRWSMPGKAGGRGRTTIPPIGIAGPMGPFASDLFGHPAVGAAARREAARLTDQRSTIWLAMMHTLRMALAASDAHPHRTPVGADQVDPRCEGLRIQQQAWPDPVRPSTL